jgi:hypothetical protein
MMTSPPSPSSEVGTYPPLGAALSPEQREEIARQIFYQMSMPLITREMLQEIESELPQLVELLASLSSRPAARDELQRTIDGLKESNSSVKRSEADQQRTVAFANMLLRDTVGEGEQRLVALIGLGLASAMASYAVVKYWQK